MSCSRCMRTTACRWCSTTVHRCGEQAAVDIWRFIGCGHCGMHPCTRFLVAADGSCCHRWWVSACRLCSTTAHRYGKVMRLLSRVCKIWMHAEEACGCCSRWCAGHASGNGW
jgi:hypothetical protein